MKLVVIVLANLFVIYFLLGILFSIIFIVKGGLNKVDSNTQESSIWFKLIIFPGLCAMWPLFLMKWIKASKT